MTDRDATDGAIPVKADHVVRVLFSEIDRLQAIEAAARDFMEFDDGPPDLPDNEWEPKARALRKALERPR